MSFSPVKGAEPIPGYQLVERLGTGGYGAVWKVTAPGGLTKAIKIVFGEMGGLKAEQELRALQRIKEVRHPFLLSLERIEIIEGQLLIVTELADGSLQERFHQCRGQGLPGIPRDELLGHLRDTADALDYMSEAHGLQHLDIKPQNLLLVGGRIKVADFGLVKDLMGTSVTATGGVTPLYAPPEAFDGRISRYSDQYSLAVVYQEMLTGIRPYPGTTIMQLAQQHISGRPLLDPLPALDRPVVARALAKTPQDRFTSCRVMVDQLLANGVAGLPVAEFTIPATPSEESAPPDNANEVGVSPVRTVPSVGTIPSKWDTLPTATSAPRLPSSEDRAILRPTLFLGVGGLAGQTLRRLKQRLQRHFGILATVPSLRLLLMDTDRAGLKAALQAGGGAALSTEETLLTPLHAQEYYRDKARDYLNWMERRWFYGISRDRTTEGVRPIGRLALVDNAAAVLATLQKVLVQITSAESRAATALASGLPLREEVPRIFLVGSLGGGTGGMLLGLAYAIQQLLDVLGLPREGLCGVLLHATTPKPSEAELARVNARATLRELHHFGHPSQPYPGDPEHGLMPGQPEQPPFPDCYLIHLGDQLSRDASAAATDLVADYLYLNTVTTAGAFLDEYREQTRVSGPPSLRTFGLDRIVFPRRPLARLAARRFCQNFLQRWRGEVSPEARPRIDQACRQQVRDLGLEEDLVIDRLNAAAESLLGESPETLFPRLATSGEAEPDTSAEQTAPLSPQEQAEITLRHIEEVLGTGTPPDGQSADISLHPVEAAFYRHAEEMGRRLGRQLADGLLTLIEDPRQRLRAAEHAARWYVEQVRTAGEHFRARLGQLRAHRPILRAQLLREDKGTRLLPLTWMRIRSERGNLKKRAVRFVDYCWLRLTEIVYESADRLLSVVNQELSPLAQELVLSQRKLTHLAAQFEPAPEPDDDGSPPPNLTELFPAASTTLKEAVDAVLARLSPAQLRQFEESFQAEVLEPRGGLWAALGAPIDHISLRERRATASLAFWALLASSGEGGQTLKEKMLDRAQQFLLSSLEDMDAAKLFVESFNEPDQFTSAVTAHVGAARPRLQVPGGWRHLLLLTPASPATTALREQVEHTAGDMPVTVLRTEDDVRLCVEAAGQSLPAVAAALCGGATIQEELVERMLVRNDVSWSPL